MRFLPVFLDLKAGPVVLIGAGELLRAKLRVLAAAGARIRVHAIDGNHDLGVSSEDAARIDIAAGDPLIADLAGVIAVVCAGAGDVGVAMSVRAKALGLPVNVMDDLDHSSFIFRPSSIAAMSWSRSHRRNVAGGGAARAREDRGAAAGTHWRARRVHRRLPQIHQ